MGGVRDVRWNSSLYVDYSVFCDGEGLAKAKACTDASHAMYERVVSLFCP